MTKQADNVVGAAAKIAPLLVLLASSSACDPGDQRERREIAPIPSAEADASEPDGAIARRFPPLAAVSAYLDGFHFYSGDLDGQVEAHHYVTALGEGRWQALIFDGTGDDARLVGVEYILSADRFASLPPAEKLLWHSHAYEVRSGLLIAPDMAPDDEYALMGEIVDTYGKTWHTWHTDVDPDIPVGIPALMMAFTGDGQVHGALVNQRDERLGIDTERIAERRASLPMPDRDPLADAWERGEVIVLEAVENEGD